MECRNFSQSFPCRTLPPPVWALTSSLGATSGMKQDSFPTSEELSAILFQGTIHADDMPIGPEITITSQSFRPNGHKKKNLEHW